MADKIKARDKGSNSGSKNGDAVVNSGPNPGSATGEPIDGPGSGSSFLPPGNTPGNPSSGPARDAIPALASETPGTAPASSVGAPGASVSTPKKSHKRRTQAELGKDGYTRKAAEASNAATAQEMADTFINVAEQMAVALAGDGAKMDDTERLLISGSLPKVLERITPEVAKQIEAISYPAMLAVGVGAYAIRVSRLLSVKAAATKAERAAPVIVRAPAPSENGQPETAPVILAGGTDNLASPDARQFFNPRGL